MSLNRTIRQLVELRDALRRGELDIDGYYLSFELAISGAPYEGRQLPPELNELINRVELVRYTKRPEDHVEAADDAIRLLSD
ncbi:hypothetical protein [Micromonospora eburnea]|uniref:Self-protective colicin-like immunity n=1 Tax=Micromonospora eburnea TaxID=227316 RepID=A0A1C6TQQ2_9ACTN|nr:hypothetical protein [Micromonospora eburnea]SCL44135.1 hypothetical protein GA0070604_0217 [Micromonospora eburnea]